MRVDHRRLHAAMPEELLYRPDVVPCHQEMRGEAVTKGVDGRRLDDPRVASCRLERPLKGSLMQVMPPSPARLADISWQARKEDEPCRRRTPGLSGGAAEPRADESEAAI
jgi:hypothetical protein